MPQAGRVPTRESIPCASVENLSTPLPAIGGSYGLPSAGQASSGVSASLYSLASRLMDIERKVTKSPSEITNAKATKRNRSIVGLWDAEQATMTRIPMAAGI